MTDAAGVAIDTAKLRMRPLLECDEALYCDLFTDPSTMQFIGPAWTRERAVRSFHGALASMARRPIERLVLTMIDRATEQAIGICSLQNFDRSLRRTELGMMVLPGSRSHGLGLEGVVAVITWAFTALPLDEVRVQIAPNNPVAVHMVVRMGFSRCEDPAGGDEALQHWSARRESWSGAAPGRC